MCGIVAFLGSTSAKPILLNGLQRLEYRGYDSAGLAVQNVQGEFFVRRAVGHVAKLVELLGVDGQQECYGIAHTRWATHGRASEANAHPHRAGEIVLVHNGIIENHAQIRKNLEEEKIQFSSQTDTEVFAQLINHYRRKLLGSEKRSDQERKALTIKALQSAMSEVEGHYAILFMTSDLPGLLFGAQNGAPMVMGQSEKGVHVASDLQAVLPYTKEITFVPANALVVADKSHYLVLDAKTGEALGLETETIAWSADRVAKDGFEHYMLKEIHEQPLVVADSLSGRLPSNNKGFVWDHPRQGHKNHAQLWSEATRLYLVACGTAYHAALVAKYYFEKLAKISVEVDYAHEFRYRDPILQPGSVMGVVSQSGETADTLAALRLASKMGIPTFAVCNVPGSTIVRESHYQYSTKAGPEVSVASTKAFMAQLTVLCALAEDVAGIRGVCADNANERLNSLARLPHDIERILAHSSEIQEIGARMTTRKTVYFLGRGLMYPLALEGALKLKEISYCHAEGYAAGELKHGPIALVDDQMTAVVLAPTDELMPKTLSNLEEIKARGASIIGIGDEKNIAFKELCDAYIGMPAVQWSLTPMLYVVPLQLLAYGYARKLECAIDKPKNLAKSVTVE